jgi:hypothetical protein
VCCTVAFHTADIIIITTTIIIIKALSVTLTLCFSHDKEVAQGMFYLPQSTKEGPGIGSLKRSDF